MSTFLRFLYEILAQFFSGFVNAFSGIWDGLVTIFNIKSYNKIASRYTNDFTVGEWVLVGVVMLVVVAIIVMLILGIIYLIRKYARFR